MRSSRRKDQITSFLHRPTIPRHNELGGNVERSGGAAGDKLILDDICLKCAQFTKVFLHMADLIDSDISR